MCTFCFLQYEFKLTESLLKLDRKDIDSLKHLNNLICPVCIDTTEKLQYFLTVE